MNKKQLIENYREEVRKSGITRLSLLESLYFEKFKDYNPKLEWIMSDLITEEELNGVFEKHDELFFTELFRERILHQFTTRKLIEAIRKTASSWLAELYIKEKLSEFYLFFEGENACYDDTDKYKFVEDEFMFNLQDIIEDIKTSENEVLPFDVFCLEYKIKEF